MPLGGNRVKRNERGDMKCIHKNDGENKIETNFEVCCDENLLIKSDRVYFVVEPDVVWVIATGSKIT